MTCSVCTFDFHGHPDVDAVIGVDSDAPASGVATTFDGPFVVTCARDSQGNRSLPGTVLNQRDEPLRDVSVARDLGVPIYTRLRLPMRTKVIRTGRLLAH